MRQRFTFRLSPANRLRKELESPNSRRLEKISIRTKSVEGISPRKIGVLLIVFPALFAWISLNRLSYGIESVDPPTPQEILERIRTSPRLPGSYSYIAKSEGTIKRYGEFPDFYPTGADYFEEAEVRAKGEDWDIIRRRVDKDGVPIYGYDDRSVYLGGKSYAYFPSPGNPSDSILHYSEGEQAREYNDVITASVTPLSNCLDIDREPFDVILQGAVDNLKVGPDMVDVEGFPCWLIEGDTAWGYYRIYVDPACGYNMRKAEVHKGGEDLWSPHLKLSHVEKVPYEPGMLKMVDYVLSLGDVVLKAGGAGWHVEKYRSTATTVYEGGQRTIVESTRSVSNVDLSPDFAALGAFTTDFIAEGAKVYRKETGGIEFEWRNGKIVPKVSEEFLRALDEGAELVKADRYVESSQVDDIPKDGTRTDFPSPVSTVNLGTVFGIPSLLLGSATLLYLLVKRSGSRRRRGSTTERART